MELADSSLLFQWCHQKPHILVPILIGGAVSRRQNNARMDAVVRGWTRSIVNHPMRTIFKSMTTFHIKRNSLASAHAYLRCPVNEPAHDTTYNKTCSISKYSDQPAHPRSLIRVLADRMYLL